MPTTIEAVFIGSLSPLPPEGQPTGIFKQRVRGPVRVTREGLLGDEHGDPRVHGGPEKAVHYFAAENHERFADALGVPAAELRPGVLGENLSGHGLVEADLCIGDVYAAGSSRLQLSQPRRPCWRIDNRLSRPKANLVLSELGCPGWYFRVLEPGTLAAGGELRLVERNPDPISVARLLRAGAAHRPQPGELRTIAATPGLNSDWAQRLVRRAEWLESHR